MQNLISIHTANDCMSMYKSMVLDAQAAYRLAFIRSDKTIAAQSVYERVNFFVRWSCEALEESKAVGVITEYGVEDALAIAAMASCGFIIEERMDDENGPSVPPFRPG